MENVSYTKCVSIRRNWSIHIKWKTIEFTPLSSKRQQVCIKIGNEYQTKEREKKNTTNDFAKCIWILILSHIWQQELLTTVQTATGHNVKGKKNNLLCHANVAVVSPPNILFCVAFRFCFCSQLNHYDWFFSLHSSKCVCRVAFRPKKNYTKCSAQDRR